MSCHNHHTTRLTFPFIYGRCFNQEPWSLGVAMRRVFLLSTRSPYHSQALDNPLPHPLHPRSHSSPSHVEFKNTIFSWTSWNGKLNVAVLVLSYRCCRLCAYWLIYQRLQVDVYTTLCVSPSSFIDTLLIQLTGNVAPALRLGDTNCTRGNVASQTDVLC